MNGHALVSVMTTGGGLARRYVCECGQSGPAVLDEGAARGEHRRHAESMRLIEQKGADS